MKTEYKRAAPVDANELTQIAVASKRHWGYPEAWMQAWTPQLSITPEFAAQADLWMAVLEDEIAGFYALVYSKERAVLEHFWILPQYMGRGVGRGLFTHALGRCRDAGCTVLEIESDPNAQGFYERMGARKSGAHITEVDGQPRVLPVLEVEL